MVKLHVRVIEAKDLLTTNSFSKGSDPYCELMIKHKFPPQRTRVLKKTCEPKWNEEFVVYPDDVKKDVLILTINGYQSLGDHSTLGQVQLVLSSLLSNPVQDVWIPLQPREGTSRKVKGEIHIQLRLDGAGVPAAANVAVYGMAVPPPGSHYMAAPPGMYYPPPSGYPPGGYAMPPGSGYPQPPGTGYPMYAGAAPPASNADPNAAYYSMMAAQGYGAPPQSQPGAVGGAPNPNAMHAAGTTNGGGATYATAPAGNTNPSAANAGGAGAGAGGGGGGAPPGYAAYTYDPASVYAPSPQGYGAPQGYSAASQPTDHSAAYGGGYTTTAPHDASGYSTTSYSTTTSPTAGGGYTTTDQPSYATNTNNTTNTTTTNAGGGGATAAGGGDPYSNYTSYSYSAPSQPSQPQSSALYPAGGTGGGSTM